MNKKHFLLLLPVCFVLCLIFTTCEEEKEEVVVTGLWEKLRNTVWKRDSSMGPPSPLDDDSILGFYGPNSGPYRDPAGDYPYIVFRTTQLPSNDDTTFLEARGGYNFFLFRSMQIDRTGHIISNSNKRFLILENSEELFFASPSPYVEDLFFSGSFSKISSDPNFDWNKVYVGTSPILNTLFGTYTGQIPNQMGMGVYTETIQINKTSFRIESDFDYLYFEISDWEETVIPSPYSSNYQNAFKITGKISSARPQSNNPPYLYGNKTAPNFTSDDINSTECWMYLYFDKYDERLIRTAFSKVGSLNETVVKGGDNNAYVYRKIEK